MADDILSPRQVLESYENKFIDALHKSLEKHDRISGGVLFQSVTAITKIYGQKVVLEISMEDYWRWVDEGVNGTQMTRNSPNSFKVNTKRIPIGSIKKFIANRGIVPTMSISQHRKLQLKKQGLKGKVNAKLLKRLEKKIVKQNKESQLNNLAFALSTNIKKKGIKATHFATEVMYESTLIAELKQDLITSVGREIEIEIVKEVKKWQ
jgi:hypothetical protein